MTSGCKTVIAFLTVICGLLFAVVDLESHWPLWTWLALLALAVGVPLLSTLVAGRRPNPVPVEMAPMLPVVPVERRDQRVTRVALPSSSEDYDFLFSATVRWNPSGERSEEPILNPAGLAIDAILERARAITEKRDPHRASLVQHELNGALGRMQRDDTKFLDVMAESVTLTLSDQDQERLDKLAAVRKDKAVWEHERKYEQSRREYLGEDVLKDTGSAVVWWLARNDDQVEKTVNDIGLLTQLSSAAQNAEVPSQFRRFVPSLEEPMEATVYAEPRPATATELLESLLRTEGIGDDDPGLPLLWARFSDVFEAHGRTDIADELRHRFEPFDTEEE
ncbi:hypothetical protein DN069_02370 [Streptacidiphilus pinicola]|uniref:Uncharacterized protein n=1 Tax=Streptacidiphilus pinicola TaxID=2219663 RepID=A0A2X0KL36_9ACTN|nr:hypothetical protein [Streptacidiphilus pinicola]RAG87380.1 hypothetical protein DN069_02370 [Streptacidiphilus pinicola]